MKFLNWLDTFLDRFDPRVLIALLVISLFAYAYSKNVGDETMKGALIAAFAGAWGYFLGSSAGAISANKRADRAIEVAAQAVEKK